VIYFIKDTASQAIKIGYSATPKKRLAGLQTGNAHKLVLLGSVPGKPDEEQAFHGKFAQHRLEGEWFKGDIIEEVLTIIATHKEERLQMRRIAMTETAGKVNGDCPPETVGGEGVICSNTGIRGISRISGLKLKRFSLTLTERQGSNGYACYCGAEIKYVLEFETSIANDPATNRHDLLRLQQAIVSSQHNTGLKHTFLDEDNAAIPFGPAFNEHHIIGGTDAITGREGEAFRVLVVFERGLSGNTSVLGGQIMDTFVGDNYPGEHPLKTAKRFVVSLR
jgi:hypothetical protein